jgi:hypothetical protein
LVRSYRILSRAHSVLLALASSRKPGQPSRGFVKPGQAISLAWPGHQSHGFRAKPSQQNTNRGRLQLFAKLMTVGINKNKNKNI